MIEIEIVMIGCGAFARRYHLPAILNDGWARIIGIVDPGPHQETRDLAHASRAPIVGSIDELSAPKGTMAVVSTPHAMHAHHVAAALARDWHVLCDKPFTMKASEARALAAEAGRRALTNAVAYNRRFDRGCLAARQAIGAGRIGPVRYVQTIQLGYERVGWFLDPALGGGGPFTGRASHMADIVPWLIGQRPTSLRSRLRKDGGSRSDSGGFIELKLGDLEWHCTCIEEGLHTWDEIRIFGEDGLIELRRPLTAFLGWELQLWTDRGRAYEFKEADGAAGGATEDFLLAMRDSGHAVSCSFSNAVPSVEIIEEAFLSARSGEKCRELGQACE